MNIHPTKNEIKFEYEQEIWPILAAAVKKSLGKFSAVPSIDFSADALPIRPVADGSTPPPPRVDYRSDYNPFSKSSGGVNPAYRPTHIDSNWQSLYENFITAGKNNPVSQPDGESLPFAGAEDSPVNPATICLQYALKYIITTSGEGLLIIDQHRAHVKILYEEYLKRSTRMETVGQTIMFPETISLDASQQSALAEVQEDLERLGFRLEYESETDWKVMAVPALLKPHAIKDTILRVLDSVSEDSGNYGNEKAGAFSMRERVALIMARSGAIKRGVKLSQNEMENLIGQLFSLPEPSLTPNGNRIFTVFTDADLSKLLG